MKAVPLTR